MRSNSQRGLQREKSKHSYRRAVGEVMQLTKIQAGLQLVGFAKANTDTQVLERSLAELKYRLSKANSRAERC